MKMRMIFSFATRAAIGLSFLGFGAVFSSNRAEAQLNFHDLFATSDQCIACHSSLTDSHGQDISIGVQWRSTMMANSARDPYWHAGVRRETIDHPEAQDEIEDTCATCHMPMARFAAHAAGGRGEVLDHVASLVEGAPAQSPRAWALAVDGVSCTVCHQILPDNFGEESSYDGGFLIDVTTPPESRRLFGKYEVDDGRVALMHSVTGFSPAQSSSMAQSELCGGCHTLFTQALDRNGQPAGVLPEQMPYPEWLHSAYAETRSCQSCHMPAVEGTAPIASVLGQPREGVSQHSFVGANAFMLRIFAQNRDALGVMATAAELEAAAQRAERHLAEETARIAVENVRRPGGQLEFTVDIESLAGHKLPTAYPSRRVWLHVTVRDGSGATVFESGAPQADGSITGNDNDADGATFEPHYTTITAPDQVQIYEPVMVDAEGAVTTGLISAVRYVKDNRLLPAGFDKASAPEEVAVHGGALEDADFAAGGDRVVYSVDVGGAQGPFTIEAELLYQSIGYRWAENLRAYDHAAEPARFLGYYAQHAADSAKLIARASVER
jgi:hypothetical protein